MSEVHGTAFGQPPDRRAAGLRRLDQGGLLTEKIVKTLHWRAAARRMGEGASGHLQHPVAGHGPRALTDTNGREANFRNVILVMTTNAGPPRPRGARSVSPSGTTAPIRWRSSAAGFQPGIPQPVDAVVQFQALGFDHILRVVDKFLIELEMRLHEKLVALSATPGRPRLAGGTRFDPLMGARPMAGHPGQGSSARW